MHLNYSIFNMCQEISQKRHLIQAHFQNKSVEGFNGKPDEVPTIFGLEIVTGLMVFIIAIVIWVWALSATIKFWHLLPVWAQVLAIIGLVSGVGGPVMTLVVVYVAKESNNIGKPISPYPSYNPQ